MNKKNGNAKKKNTAKTDKNPAPPLHVRCKGTDKDSWKAKAKKASKSLTKWVIDTLNSAK